MEIILVTGKARAGKDTVGAYLERAHGFKRYAMAGPLKEMLRAGLGLDQRDFETTEQKEAVIPWLGCSYRHATQTLGTEWGRCEIADDLWLRLARKAFDQALYLRHPGVVVTDGRFENEAEFVRQMGGTVVHILRNAGTQEGMSDQGKAHASERGITLQPGDPVLYNFGTVSELERSAELMLQKIRGLA